MVTLDHDREPMTDAELAAALCLKHELDRLFSGRTIAFVIAALTALNDNLQSDKRVVH
jgi:hypothetical protein